MTQLLEYDGAFTGPFAQNAPVGPGCLLNDTACSQQVQRHLLPASLSYMAFSWFASRFRPVDDGRPQDQYPIWRVDKRCPKGAHEYTAYQPFNGLAQNGVLEPGDCYTCPVGMPSCTDTPFFAERVSPIVRIHYLANPDGDGLHAPEDKCPFVQSFDNHAQDADGDTVPDDCDNCPLDPNTDQEDVDHDGLGFPCDPCDGTQRDFDLDGHADGCELPTQCPCDPWWLGHDNDDVCNFCDGTLGGPGSFCESYCGGPVVARLDNCPDADNDEQDNCNRESEDANHVEPLGDACDPVPCPQFATVYDTFNPVYEAVDPSATAVFQTVTTRWLPFDRIDVAPLGSHRSDATGSINDGWPVRVDNTFYMYCADIPALQINCESTDYLGHTYLNNAQSIADETRDSIWHRVKLVELPTPGAADPLRWYGVGHGWSRRWDWRDDFLRWTTLGSAWGAPYLPLEPSTPDEGAGRMWVRGDTQVGVLDAADIGTGTRQLPNGLDAEGNEGMLAGYAYNASPLIKEESNQFHAVPDSALHPFWARLCLECPEQAIGIDVDTCINCGAVAPVMDRADIFEAQPLLYLGSEVEDAVGALNHNGSFTPVKVGAALEQSLAAGFVWLDAAEAIPRLGGARPTPAAVALSAEGTAVVEKAWLAGHKLRGNQDLLVDIIDAMTDQPVLSSEPSLVGAPAPRSAFAGVYSRANERIFLVGGEDPNTGDPMGDIWWRTVDGTRWYRVPTSSYAPEKVLAATYSYRDRRVWILDELRQGWSRKARLTRVDPSPGEAEVIGTWPRLRRFDKHWLVLDRDGSILLVASSSKLHRHVVARIRNDGESPELDGIRLAPRPLAFAPGVDARGYSFVVRHGKKLRVRRLAGLDAKPGHWFEAGECL